jgi:hypothetical protein
MRASIRTWHLAALAGSLLVTHPQTLGGQEPCATTMTVSACYTKLHDALGQALRAARDSSLGNVQRELVAKPTGTPASTNTTGTGIEDFLPRLAAAVLSPGLTSDPKALGLHVNLPLNDGILWRTPFVLQLASVAHEAVLYDTLLALAPQAVRAALRDSLSRTLADYDDVTLGIALNLDNKTWGRSYRPRMQEISLLDAQLLAPLDNVVATAWQTFAVGVALLPVARSGGADCPPTNPDQRQIDCYTEAGQAKLLAAVGAFAATVADAERRAAEALKAAGFDKIDELLNNQPQLNARFEYRSRRDIVGPNEVTGKVRLEYSPASYNGLRAYCSAEFSSGITPKCLQAYTSAPAVRQSIERGDRFWLEVVAANVHGYDVTLPGAVGRLVTAATWTVEPAVGYGFYLGSSEQRSRFDFELRYRASADGAVRASRFTAAATMSQRISDQSNAVIGLSWANKAEFLGAVEKKLRANVGLSYKLVPVTSVGGP